MTMEADGRDRAGVERWQTGAGPRRRAPVPNGPELELVIGADDGHPFGVLDVTVPVGAALPEHEHGASEALLVPLHGTLRLVETGEVERVAELEPGTLATIRIGCRVRLENTGNAEARLLVVLSPADFVAQVDRWPAADEVSERA